jgi:hypothetical protein
MIGRAPSRKVESGAALNKVVRAGSPVQPEASIGALASEKPEAMKCTRWKADGDPSGGGDRWRAGAWVKEPAV